MLYTIWFEVASLMFLLIIWIFYKVQYQSKNLINQRFQILMFCVFFMTLTDIISAITISYYMLVPRWVNYLSNGSNYIFVGVSGYAFVLYVRTLVFENETKTPLIPKLVICSFLIGELINPFFGYFYSFDETGYIHGPYYLIQMAASYYFVIYTGYIFFKRGRNMSVRKRVGTGSYVILMFVIGFVQVFVIPSFLMTGFASTLTILIIFLLMETPDYYKLMNAMDELERARVAANEANEAKSKFLASMSHEIRTPLNAVLGMDEMILREATNPDILDYARNIKASGNTLLGIINDILDFSKIESGMMTINEHEYNISATITNIQNMMSNKAKDKGLEFGIIVDPNIPHSLMGDEMRISQIIINLTNNAIKYTEKGSVKIHFSALKAVEDTVLFEIAVVDTGIGIREEDKQKLFEEFERLELSRNRNIEGTGLGLAITSKLVQQMQGRISVESVYGKGSTFRAIIPQKIVDVTPIGTFEYKSVTQEDEAYSESFIAPDARILAVDDNSINLQVLKKLLKRTQVQITAVTSGKKALEIIAKEKFDVILLDHMMPEMDGIQVLHKAKELEKEIGIRNKYIVLTANAIQGVEKMYLGEGFDDYISKPINSKELEHKLLKYITSSQSTHDRGSRTVPGGD